jgi:DNA polymerase-3 subunit alpha
MQDFIHLHVHTHYSILDGQSKVPYLVDKAIKDGMKGMALTDHGVMFGIKSLPITVIKSTKTARKRGKNLLSPSSDVRCMSPITIRKIK